MINENPLLLSNTIIKLSKSNINEAIKLIDTIEDDHIYQETVYRVAKNVYITNKSLTINLINKIIHNTKYFNGYRAYTYCIDQDEEGIDTIVNYLKVTYLAGQLDIEQYIENLNEIVFSIVEHCPSKAKYLLEEIDNMQ